MCRTDLTARLKVLTSALLKSFPADSETTGRVNRLFDRINNIPWVYEMVQSLEDPEKALALVLNDSEHRVCLLAKAVPGGDQLALRDFRAEFGKTCDLSGGAIMREEEVDLILYVVELPNLESGNCKSARAAGIEPGWHLESLNAA